MSRFNNCLYSSVKSYYCYSGHCGCVDCRVALCKGSINRTSTTVTQKLGYSAINCGHCSILSLSFQMYVQSYSCALHLNVYLKVRLLFQIDEMTSMAMTRYRTQIWVKLRENRLNDERWLEYHRFCPAIFPGDRVCIRGSDGTWSRNIIDHIGAEILFIMCITVYHLIPIFYLESLHY